MQIKMLQDPISKPPDVGMDVSRAGAAVDHRRNKPNSANSEQVLKCPRCDSLNTKFCYYNNYSLTQPRHFCKNCRRYWTQGGSLRNVPIGGGCRKNKRVKQRTVDPHLFGGLVEDQYNAGPGSLLMQHGVGTSGVPSSLLSATSCFAGGPSAAASCLPGFSDLVPGNDSFLLSMAFSRLHDESLRLGTSDDQLQIGAKPLSQVLHSNPLYDNATNNYNVKSEHHHLFNGSDHLTCTGLFEHSAPNAGTHLSGGSAGGLPSSDHPERLSNFGVPAHVDALQGAACSGQLQLNAHLKQLQQERAAQALALHLGGGGAAPDIQHDPMQNPASCSSNAGSCAGRLDESSSRSLPERYLEFHRRHHVLPGFEDQESPDQSMSSIMNMRRGGAGQTNYKLFPAKGMGNVEDECSLAAADHHEGWQQGAVLITGNDQPQTHESGVCPRLLRTDQAYIDQPTSSIIPAAGTTDHLQQSQMSFWSPSPWTNSTAQQLDMMMHCTASSSHALL